MWYTTERCTINLDNVISFKCEDKKIVFYLTDESTVFDLFASKKSAENSYETLFEALDSIFIDPSA